MAEPAGDRALGPGDPVIVVGATGLIGRAVARALDELELRVLAVSRSAPGRGVLPRGMQHLALDRSGLPELLQPGGRLRAELRVERLGIVEVVADAPEPVARLLSATEDLPGRVVAFSSAAVFGNAPRGQRFDEAAPPSPQTDAMRAKVRIEELLRATYEAGRTAVALRCAYPYGPGHAPLTPIGRDRQLFARLRAGAPVTWVEEGALAPLQPVWSADLGAAVGALLNGSRRPRPLYHAAGPETLSWTGYLEALAGATELPPAVRQLPVATLLAEHPDFHWLAEYFRDAPLLDDSLLRQEVYACETRLGDAAGTWAAWCDGGTE